MNLRIKVNANRKVTDPETGKELAPGTVYLVRDSIFWRRRLQSADVSEAGEPPKAETADRPIAPPADDKPAGSPTANMPAGAEQPSETSRSDKLAATRTEQPSKEEPSKPAEPEAKSGKSNKRFPSAPRKGNGK
ncbi:MAG: hypothetical protein LBE84_04450 [Planctomycetota bacterium]|jgi:hypothetical protein|nr:hypothetical protein [Planctomycetota bacterium]